MKKILFMIGVLNMVSFGMSLDSTGIKNGYIDDRYGKYGTENVEGMPSLSLPLEWKEVPKGTKSFAIVMEDMDAIPVVGFSWIHWVTLVPGTYMKLEENASQKDLELVQGVNSWVSPLGKLDKKIASHFGGPAPPDKDHTYTFKIYALDKEIKLEKGFYLNELYIEMKGHILGEALLEGRYRK